MTKIPDPRLRWINDVFVWEFPDGRRLPLIAGGANTFLTPDIIARLAYANLYENAVLAQLVHRDYEADFDGQVGDTITIRKPPVLEADEFDRSTGTTAQNATETGIPVTLDTILDVTVVINSEEWTLELADFNQQIVQPAMQAFVQAIDRKILTLRDDITQTVGASTPAYNTPLVIPKARQQLNRKNVPMAQRSAVWGPDSETGLISDPLFHQAQERGDTVGLIEASIGRKFGFDHYMDQNIKEPTTTATGDPTTEVNVAFHRTAFALVMRTLALPRGAASAAVFGDQGMGVRVVYGYDMSKKQDTVSFDLLCGVKTLDANRACLVQGPLHA